MLKRYGPCIGFSSPPIFKKYKIELWFCPPKYLIPKHKHESVDIYLCYLFGNDVIFWKEFKTAFMSWRNIFRVFKIRAGQEHWFQTNKTWLVFINFEVWKTKPTSAAEDFILT